MSKERGDSKRLHEQQKEGARSVCASTSFRERCLTRTGGAGSDPPPLTGGPEHSPPHGKGKKLGELSGRSILAPLVKTERCPGALGGISTLPHVGITETPLPRETWGPPASDLVSNLCRLCLQDASPVIGVLTAPLPPSLSTSVSMSVTAQSQGWDIRCLTVLGPQSE